MSIELAGLLVTALSFVVSLLLFPHALRFARRHNVVDNPNERKLQRVPVPVMGGIPVYAGVMLTSCFAFCLTEMYMGLISIVAMTIMLVIGVWDDIKGLPATLRFLVEIVVVWSLMAVRGIIIDDFHGLWGVGEIGTYLSLPLSLVAGVGIINAVNLIDGVDGYSSSYGILTNFLFAMVFYAIGEYSLALLGLACMGALLPFFFHNVFGKTTKMFFGDGGTLMLGMVMTIFVFSLLSGERKGAEVLVNEGVGLVALALALLAIPVFDTLRVMSARIVRGHSPFHPDKTHLHHLFISMGFSHLGTTFAIMCIQTGIIVAWLLAWWLGAGVDVQLYVVIFLGMGVTFGFYRYMMIQQSAGPKDEDGDPTGSKVWKCMCRIGAATHMERGSWWLWLQRLADKI